MMFESSIALDLIVVPHLSGLIRVEVYGLIGNNVVAIMDPVCYHTEQESYCGGQFSYVVPCCESKLKE